MCHFPFPVDPDWKSQYAAAVAAAWCEMGVYFSLWGVNYLVLGWPNPALRCRLFPIEREGATEAFSLIIRHFFLYRRYWNI